MQMVDIAKKYLVPFVGSIFPVVECRLIWNFMTRKRIFNVKHVKSSFVLAFVWKSTWKLTWRRGLIAVYVIIRRKLNHSWDNIWTSIWALLSTATFVPSSLALNQAYRESFNAKNGNFERIFCFLNLLCTNSDTESYKKCSRGEAFSVWRVFQFVWLEESANLSYKILSRKWQARLRTLSRESVL